MPRPFTDIQACISGNVVKNGSIVTNARPGGIFSKELIGAESFGGLTLGFHNNISSLPTIATLSNKYGNRFYNGVFVRIASASGVIG
jgi:hypothetical protein